MGVMLAGRLNNRPFLWTCAREDGSTRPEIRQGDSGELSVGVARPIELEEEYASLISTAISDGEEGIVRAIRLVSSALPDEVNGNVCLRRLSNGFLRDWHLAAS